MVPRTRCSTLSTLLLAAAAVSACSDGPGRLLLPTSASLQSGAPEGRVANSSATLDGCEVLVTRYMNMLTAATLQTFVPAPFTVSATGGMGTVHITTWKCAKVSVDGQARGAGFYTTAGIRIEAPNGDVAFSNSHYYQLFAHTDAGQLHGLQNAAGVPIERWNSDDLSLVEMASGLPRTATLSTSDGSLGSVVTATTLLNPAATPPGDNSVRFWWHERNDGNFSVVRIEQHSPVWRQSHLAPLGSRTVTATGVLGAILGATSSPNQASFGTGYADMTVKIVSF
jgi:hypothetical protein